MRLIDAENLIGLCNIMADKCDGIGESIWNQFAETVRWCPTIDAEPVRHGKWDDKRVAFYRKCSECGATIINTLSHVFLDYDIRDLHYCPNCGAKMDVED